MRGNKEDIDLPGQGDPIQAPMDSMDSINNTLTWQAPQRAQGGGRCLILAEPAVRNGPEGTDKMISEDEGKWC